MNRVHIWTRLIWLGAFLLGKHLAGPDATFRSINLISLQHPLCAPRFSRGQLRKGVETTQNLNHSRALQPQPASCRGPAEGLHFSCLFKTGSHWHLSTALSNCAAYPALSAGCLSVCISQRKFLIWVDCSLQFWTPACPFWNLALNHHNQKGYPTLPKSQKEFFLEKPKVDGLKLMAITCHWRKY